VTGTSTLLDKQVAQGSAIVVNPYTTTVHTDPSLLLFGGNDFLSDKLRRIASSVCVQPSDEFLVTDVDMKRVPDREEVVKEYEVRDSALARFRPYRTHTAAIRRLQQIEQSVPILMFAAQAMKHKMLTAEAQMQAQTHTSVPSSRPGSTHPQSETYTPPATAAHSSVIRQSSDPSNLLSNALNSGTPTNGNAQVNSQAQTTLELARSERIARLGHERRCLLAKLDAHVRDFDAAIADLRTDRAGLVADLKQTQLKLIVLYQEYQLLQTFEARDTSLQQKQLRCLNDKNEAAQQTTEAKVRRSYIGICMHLIRVLLRPNWISK
jgi:hypothetical protein